MVRQVKGGTKVKLTVSHNGGKVVTVRGLVGSAVKTGDQDLDDPDNIFDEGLAAAHHILTHFHQSEPGSTWGCDGVGYHTQKKAGQVKVNKSGVGPRKFRQGLQAAQACGCYDLDKRIS